MCHLMSHICPQFSYIFFPWDFMALCLFCFDSKFMIQFLIFIMFSISPIVKHSLLERPSGFWKYRCTFVAVTMESDSPFLFYIWFFFKYILLAMYSDDNPKYIIEWRIIIPNVSIRSSIVFVGRVDIIEKFIYRDTKCWFWCCWFINSKS